MIDNDPTGEIRYLIKKLKQSEQDRKDLVFMNIFLFASIVVLILCLIMQ